MKILICVPVFNRRKITELVLQNLNRYKADAQLWVYNDWSTEYDNDFLKTYCDRVFKLPPSNRIVVKNEKNENGMGVQHLRWYQFREFTKQEEFDCIYFTDSDALHDPNFIDVLKTIHGNYNAKYGQPLPVSLYDTIWHSQPQNLFKEESDVWIRKTAPGISQMYSKEMVQKVVNTLNQQKADPDYAWDYRAQEYLGLPFATTRVSYVEHFGAVAESMHTQSGDWDRDRAQNPSQYLTDIRDDVIAYLEGRGSIPQI